MTTTGLPPAGFSAAREFAKLPPTEYISAATLQWKNSQGTSFGSKTDRFKQNKMGSHFAIATAEPSSFRMNNPYHKPKVPQVKEIPQHRPLWQSELRK